MTITMTTFNQRKEKTMKKLIALITLDAVLAVVAFVFVNSEINKRSIYTPVKAESLVQEVNTLKVTNDGGKPYNPQQTVNANYLQGSQAKDLTW